MTAAFALGQIEPALRFYTLALILIILGLVPSILFSWETHCRAGEPYPVRFAVVESLTVPVDLVRQNTAGVMSPVPGTVLLSSADSQLRFRHQRNSTPTVPNHPPH